MGLTLFLGVVGLAAGVSSSQASAQATATQRQQAQQQAQFERRRSIRQMLMERQLAVNISAATGLEGSSGARGGITSIGSQFGTNLGYGSLQSGLSNQYFNQTQRAQTLQGVSSLFMGLSSASAQIASSGISSLPTVASVPNKGFTTDPYARSNLPIIGPAPAPITR